MKTSKLKTPSSYWLGTRAPQRSVCLLLATLAAVGCGSWIGNPGKGSSDGEEGGEPPITGNTASVPGGGSHYLTAAPGEVLMQTVTLAEGDDFQAAFRLSAGGRLLAADEASAFEVSLVAANGTEAAYTRKDQENTGIGFTPTSGGEYTVLLKNNSTTTVQLEQSELSGQSAADDAVHANKRADAPYKDYTLKAVVAFSTVCKQTLNAGASTTDFTAPAGHYYVQPFVFWGKVNADASVTALSDAVVSIESAGVSVGLKRLADLPLAAYREHSSLAKADHENYTRAFYQQYFGAMGEFYTVDTFRFGGDCASAKTIPIANDAGLADISLHLVDAGLGIDKSFKLRPSLSAAFSMYESSGKKLSDWTQCTYNRLTGEPTTYNGDATACKSFSLAKPPYIALDYKMPSETTPGVTAVSDPTRILYYGHSFAKQWYEEVIANAQALAAGTKTSISLKRCLNNGGLTAVPVSKTAINMPLREFNVAVGDVVNLGRKAGSYTALTDFYQGNVNAATELVYPTCIPLNGDACASFKQITVKMSSCTLKADSGISATALGQNFIYPEYFDISGIITE